MSKESRRWVYIVISVFLLSVFFNYQIGNKLTNVCQKIETIVQIENDYSMISTNDIKENVELYKLYKKSRSTIEDICRDRLSDNDYDN